MYVIYYIDNQYVIYKTLVKLAVIDENGESRTRIEKISSQSK